MTIATVKDSVELIGALSGILTGVVGTIVAIMAYRKRQPAPAPQPQDTLGSGVVSPPRVSQGRISAKAIVAAILGIGGVSYAGLLSLAAALGESPDAVADAAVVALVLTVSGIVLGFLARSDIRQNPARRGKLMSALGIFTGAMGCLVAIGATQVKAEDVLGPVNESGPAITFDQPVSASSAGADLVASQLSPVVEQQIQERVPDVIVGVDSLACQFTGPAVGTCNGSVSDSNGSQRQLVVQYEITDPTVGSLVWLWQVL